MFGSYKQAMKIIDVQIAKKHALRLHSQAQVLASLRGELQLAEEDEYRKHAKYMHKTEQIGSTLAVTFGPDDDPC